jgi:hypothetical protein
LLIKDKNSRDKYIESLKIGVGIAEGKLLYVEKAIAECLQNAQEKLAARDPSKQTDIE